MSRDTDRVLTLPRLQGSRDTRQSSGFGCESPNYLTYFRHIICPLLGAHDEHLSCGVDDFGCDGLQLVDV